MAAIGVAMYAGLMLAYAALPSDLREGSNDLRIYRVAGEEIVAGVLPYRDFFIEYPPGSLPFFVPPALLSNTAPAYNLLFANEMALLLLAAMVMTALAARRLAAGSFYPVLPAATFALCAVLLWPVAVTRYDAVVAASLALGLPLAARGGTARAVLAYASLGLGAAAKLVPALATLPLALARRREAPVGYAAFGLVLAAFGLPALAYGGERFLASFAYHLERGVQIESVASSVLILLGNVESVALEFGAFQVEGPGSGLAQVLGAPVTALLLLLTLAVAWARRPADASDGGGEYYARYAAALVLAFVIGSKVLSPQYVVWLLPLVPLAARGRAGALLCGLLVLSAGLTSLVYPVYYDALLVLEYPAPYLLMARNAALILLWVLLLALPAEARGKGVPA